MVLGWWFCSNRPILIKTIFHTEISPFRCVQCGTCGSENCDGRGLMYSGWPIIVGWVAGSGWMPIWFTRADQLTSALPEPGCQSYPPQSPCVTCGSSVKTMFWIWSLRPGYSKVSWDLWNGTACYERITPCTGCQYWNLGPTVWGTIVSSIVTTWSWPICQKWIGISHMVSDTWHRSEPTVDKKDSPLGS